MATTPNSPQTAQETGPAAPTGTPEHSNVFNVDLEKGEAPPKGFTRGKTVVLLCALIVVALFSLDLVGTLVGNRRDARLVEDKASLTSDRVAHVFDNSVDGVVERWTATTRGDTKTQDQIRRATSDLVITRRNMGDFSVGGKKNLTGREVIEVGIESITITRSEISGGAEMRYATSDKELQAALQSWAAAQQG
jgi:hypothetical protein